MFSSRLQRRADGPPLPELRPVEQVQEHEGQLRQLRRSRLHHRVILAQLILLIIIKESVHGVPYAVATGSIYFDLNLLPSCPVWLILISLGNIA